MTIRAATEDRRDFDAIGHHRQAMFEDMGSVDQRTLDAMSARFRPWLERKIAAGEYLAWFAMGPDESIIGGLGPWLMDWPPHTVAAGAWRGNILNVYTEPDHRRRGVARALMQVALDWYAENGVEAVILHASPEGRARYESLGFTATNEMRLIRPSS